MIEQAIVSLTTDAMTQLKTLLAAENNPSLGLRVFGSGGSCSGIQYGMALDDNVRAEDQVIEAGGVKVIVDKLSVQHIAAPRSTTSTASWAPASRSTTRTRSAPVRAGTPSTRATMPARRRAAAAATSGDSRIDMAQGQAASMTSVRQPCRWARFGMLTKPTSANGVPSYCSAA